MSDRPNDASSSDGMPGKDSPMHPAGHRNRHRGHHLLKMIRFSMRESGRRLARHRVEILWALAFAVPCAWAAARLVDPPSHDPYKIQILEAKDTDRETRALFADLATKWPHRVRSMGDVPVEVVPSELSDNTVAAATAKAEELVRAPDTLMVIGHLPSGITEAILPIFLKARPQMPYISTAASADDLLEGLRPEDVAIDGFVPLIQPSPRNHDQGDSAIRYAVEHGRHRFVMVTDAHGFDDPYAASLLKAWREAIERRKTRASEVGRFTMADPPPDVQFKVWQPDCLLYAGDAAGALSLMKVLALSKSLEQSLAKSTGSLMAVFADSVIETRSSDESLKDLSEVRVGGMGGSDSDETMTSTDVPSRRDPMTSLRFTYASNADDYNIHDNEFAEDALRIADQLIADLSERGGDFRYRAKALLHMETIDDARRNLTRIMEENMHMRSWYECSSSPCVFWPFLKSEGMYHATRRNGMFHVWQLRRGMDGRGKEAKGEMEDVDGWHPPKTVADSVVVTHGR